MRRKLLRSVTSQVFAWSAALSLAAPIAAAQEAGTLAGPGAGIPAAASPGASAGGGAPLAAVSGVDENECELITAQKGDSAVIAEKTKEKGQAFLFLQGDEFMLDEFRVENRKECASLFGFFPGGGTQAAAAGASAGAGFGSSLAGAGIGAAVGAGIGAAVVGAVIVSTVVAAPNNTTSAVNSITAPVSPQ